MDIRKLEYELDNAYKHQSNEIYQRLLNSIKTKGYRVYRDSQGRHRIIANNQAVNKKKSGSGIAVMMLLLPIFFIVVIPGISKIKNTFSGYNTSSTQSAVSYNRSTEEKEKVEEEELEDYAYDSQTEAVISQDDSGVEYVSNIVIVYFNDSATENDKQNVVSKVNGEIVGRFDSLNQLQIKIETKDYAELNILCDDIKTMDNVIAAYIDTVVEQDVEPYYPIDGYEELWDVNAPGGQNWGQEKINAPELWGYKDQMASIPVAVIDAGFDTIHPDLNGYINISSNSKDPSIVPRHGTLTSGVIGAGFDNGIGISGIAPNAAVTGYSLGSERVTSNDIYANVIQAVKDGNKVINISFGSSTSLPDCNSTRDYNNEGMAASIAISSLLDQGYDFMVVQSAGNGSADGLGVDSVYNGMFCSITEESCYTDNHSYSEIMDHVIIVAAAAQTEDGVVLDSYSNGGSRTTVCAPGSNIYSTVVGGCYDYASGTSLSAPFVTGTIAAVWGLDPSLSAASMKTVICESATEYISVNPSVYAYEGSCPIINAGVAANMVSANNQIEEECEDEIEESTEIEIEESNEESFYSFLRYTYDNADEYVDGYPVYDPEEIGNGFYEVWLDYVIVDFDGDGEDELLVKKELGRDAIFDIDGANFEMLDVYELVDGEVVFKIESSFCSDLSSPETEIYNNQIILSDWSGSDGYDFRSINCYVFDQNVRDSLGLYDSEFFSYDFSKGDEVTRHQTAAGYLGDSCTMSYNDSVSELESIVTGDSIDFTVHQITDSGIEDIAY